MKARHNQCDAITIEGGEAFTAYIDHCAPDRLLLTIVDCVTSNSWSAQAMIQGAALDFIANTSAEVLTQLLTHSHASPPDTAEIARQAQFMILQRRRQRQMDLQTARLFYRAAGAILLTDLVDDMPEAIMEMLYGVSWREHYPRVRPPHFEDVRRKVAQLQAAVLHIPISPATSQIWSIPEDAQ